MFNIKPLRVFSALVNAKFQDLLMVIWKDWKREER
jgi:hypothetical protein